MSGFMKFVIGLILLIILGCIGFYSGLFTGYHTTPANAQAKLQQEVNYVLATKGHDWATVTMNGQEALVRGDAPSQEALDLLHHDILSADGPFDSEAGGLVTGGVTVVNVQKVEITSADTTPEIAVITPYTWSASYADNGPITLKGYVPNEEARAEIIAKAEALYPAGVVDEMETARGAPSSDWTQAAIQKITALKILDRGEVRGVDERFTLFGEVPSEDAKRSAEAALAPFIANYSSVMTITTPTPVEIEPAEEPAEPVLSAETVAAIENCQQLFNTTLEGKTINFASSRALINANSYPLLNKLAEVAKECSAYKIEVAGHTDFTGDEVSNMTLSEARAQAVVNYLANKDVSITQMTVKGYGETTPIADNRTRAGRALNRRIEFNVSGQ